MMNAYDVIYLKRAARIMGNMLHDAVYGFGYAGNEYMHLFAQTEVAQQIEVGNPKYVAGMSGRELLSTVIEQTTDYYVGDTLIETYERSDAYWVGWVLAHYQWYSGRCFSDILEKASYDDLCGLYYPFHEADVSKIYEILDERFEEKESKLKETRNLCNLTQEELAKQSGVSLNTIRAYERNAKDIHKAQMDIVLKLAKALKCRVEDIV